MLESIGDHHFNDLCIAIRSRYTNSSNIYTWNKGSDGRNEYEKLTSIKTLSCLCCSRQCKQPHDHCIEYQLICVLYQHMINLTTTIQQGEEVTISSTTAHKIQEARQLYVYWMSQNTHKHMHAQIYRQTQTHTGTWKIFWRRYDNIERSS